MSAALKLATVVQANGDLAAALDHVVVCQDDTRRIDDHAGADATHFTVRHGKAVMGHLRHIFEEVTQFRRQHITERSFFLRTLGAFLFLLLDRLIACRRRILNHHHGRQHLLRNFAKRLRQRPRIIGARPRTSLRGHGRRLSNGTILGTCQ